MSFRDDGPLSSHELNKMMRDPSTSNCRIFIGNLPPKLEKQEIEEKFGQHGKLIGIVMNRGFAFVQFADEASAAAAISAETGRVVYGRKLDVKAARVGSGDKMSNQDTPSDMIRERSPLRSGPGEGRGRDWRDRDRFDGQQGFGMGRGRGGMDRDPDRYFGRGDPFPRDDFRGGPPDDFRGPPDDFRGPPDDFRGPIDDMRGPPGRDFGGPPFRGGIDARGPLGGSGPMEYPPAKFPVSERTNDCEIIVVNKICTDYAESIERRLKKVGLTVDLLFPNEEVPLGRVLANISGRGTLYAIVITPIHEERRSLTLNILYGQPQEHRNMPVEAALPMIARNFDAYMRGEKGLGPGPVSVGGMVHGIDRHPEAIQTLLNLLKENRQLTVLQYDKVIRYLQEKREDQVKLEVGDAKGLPSADLNQPTSKQQEVLQHRILNILNQTGSGSGDNSPVPAPVPSPWTGGQAAPPSGGSGPGGAPLLNDPTVQKALDSLIQGDLLRKINPSAPAANAAQPLFNAYAGQRKF